jgi:uncharacterized protein YndB with AHSA1/START domain
MPTNRDFKRLVRARMVKTGEAYTTARAQLLNKKLAAPVRTPPKVDYAALAGISDASIKAKTGCTWERWVFALDYLKAHTWPHREIAAYVVEKYKISGWWAQTVTVGYERIKGLRAIGQRRGGGFEASKSRVMPIPIGRLYRSFTDARSRARWLPGVKLTVRSATRFKYVRLTWPDRTLVQIGFIRKGPKKSQVAIQHGSLPDRQSANRMKEFWAERLAALERALTPGRQTG